MPGGETSTTDLLFPSLKLSSALLNAIARMNPWWQGRPHPPLPATRRHLVGQIRRRLDAKLAPIIVVRGPRQIGKSTAQMQVLDDLLKAVTNALSGPSS